LIVGSKGSKQGQSGIAVQHGHIQQKATSEPKNADDNGEEPRHADQGNDVAKRCNGGGRSAIT